MSRGDYIPPRYAVIAPPYGRHNDRDTPLSPARRGRDGAPPPLGGPNTPHPPPPPPRRG